MRMGSEKPANGSVLACFHNEWKVALDSGEVLRCSVRARHFAGMGSEEKLLVPGDRVEVALFEDGARVIERRFPRETVLSRQRPRMKRDVEQVIVANAEQLVAVRGVKFGKVVPATTGKDLT